MEHERTGGDVTAVAESPPRGRARLELRVLLPEAPDARDACVARLEELVAAEQGVNRTHVAAEDGTAPLLCLHYDPDVVSLEEVERLASAAGTRVARQFGHAVLPIRAIEGEDAALRIEDGLRSLDGVLAASVNLAAQRAGVEFDRSRTSLEQVQARLKDMGYAPEPSTGWYAENKELAWSLTGGVLLAIGWVGESWFGLPSGIAIALFVAAYAFGGFDLVSHNLEALREGHFTFDIDLLMLLAAIGAAVLGEWAEGAFLLFLFSLAHALEHYALGRARGAIRALADLAPPIARVLRDGRTVEVPVASVAVGDVVLVRPGDRVPTDGTVRAGRSAVDQAPITGESVPVEKEVGDDVFAGTVNGDGAIEVTTTRAAGDRTLDRVMQLVEEAQTQKAPTQRFTERFERIFVPAVLIADVLLIVVPPLLGIWPWDLSFYRGMALLVAASPCALALGTPSAVLAGVAQAARRGVLIKGGVHLENLGVVRAIALDKTGTLTLGRPEVTELVPADGVSAAELLATAAAVERQSQHPLAAAVVRRAEADGVAVPAAGELMSVTGRGIRSSIDGQVVEVGTLRLWEDGAEPVPAAIREMVERLQADGQTTMAVRRGERWLGVLGVADQPRPDARAVLEKLRALGLRRLVLLTGDNRGVGEVIGRKLGVDEVRAGLLPEDKVTAIRALLQEHGQVAMVGDGVNDAPALANATVGIAMGAAGTAAALETADVALMADNLNRLPFAIGLSRQARAVIRQNLVVSLAIVAVLIVSTVTGVLGIGPTVLVHEGSSLLVIANALRLMAYEPRA